MTLVCGLQSTDHGLKVSVPFFERERIMIKYLLVVLLLSMTTLPAASDSSSWQWSFGPYGGKAYVGTSPLASNNKDLLDVAMTAQPYINIATYHQEGDDGWTGPTGFYQQDMCSPLEMIPGTSKTWRLYYWNNADSPSSWLNTDLTWHYGLGVGESPPENIEYTLTFVRLPVGMEEWNPPSYASPALGETIVLNEQSEGNWVLWSY